MEVTTLCAVIATCAVVGAAAGWGVWRGLCRYLSDLDNFV